MPWKCGSGLSTSSAANAAAEAMAALDGAPPSFGLVFASPRQDLGAAMAAVAHASGCASLIGCSTAGELTERGLIHGGISTLLVSAPGAVQHAGFAREISRDQAGATRQLCAGFTEAAARATAAGQPHSTSLVLVDGLTAAGEGIVGRFRQETRPSQQVVGGAAGDEDRFRECWVAHGNERSRDAAAALHLFGPVRWGVGVDHGLRPQSRRMTVTRAQDGVVLELDGRTAYDTYRAFARERGAELTRENAQAFLLANSLGVYFLDELRWARAPLAFTAEGGVVCAAAIPQGSTVAILDGAPEQMVAASGRAAAEARRNLGGAEAAGVLVFDCICRGKILGGAFQREIDAVRAAFPATPVAGFLTYGEIARSGGRLDGWHNTTAVVVAIPR
jgi:hypothetical protein